ncbi:MAG: hypothetical protein KC591_13265 [Gemmatimonadetes bacterium]|nr:hypothetical protein [Gemmatimonadota bacterium]
MTRDGDRSRAWLPFALLVAVLAARAVLAWRLAPGRDEVAYWAWAHLREGYSPALTTTIRIATNLLGDSARAIRLPGVIAATSAPFVLASIVRARGASTPIAGWTALALAASLGAAWAGVVAHPDAWLLLAASGFAATAGARPPGVGPAASAALTALSKPVGGILGFPAAWLAIRRFRSAPAQSLLSLLILAVGAVLVATRLDSETRRGLAELGRFAAGTGVFPRIAWTALELLANAGPGLLYVAGVGAFRGRRDDVVRLTGLGWVAVFATFLLAGQAKANWFLPGLLLLAPAGADALGRAGRTRRLAALTLASIGWLVAVGALIAAPGWSDRLRGWPAIDRTYAIHVGPREGAVSSARRWSERFREYAELPARDPRVTAALERGAILGSRDYGLAFGLAWAHGRPATGSPPRVWLPTDPVFATSTGELPLEADVVWVEPRGTLPPAAVVAAFREFRAAAAHPAEPGIEPGLEVFYGIGYRGLVASAP